MIKSGDQRTIRHLEYWLGDLLGNLSSSIKVGTSATVTHPYFEHIGLQLADMMISDFLNETSIRKICNKLIYRELMSDMVPPKIVRESDLEYDKVWTRLHSIMIKDKAREIIYLIVHNKLPVAERMFRIKLRQDPYCIVCVGAEIADIEHYFCRCCKVECLWQWLRSKVNLVDVRLNTVLDKDLVNLCFGKTDYEKEVTWLIGHYVKFVWDRIYVREAQASLDTLIGYLKFKYRDFQNSCSLYLRNLKDLGL